MNALHKGKAIGIRLCSHIANLASPMVSPRLKYPGGMRRGVDAGHVARIVPLDRANRRQDPGVAKAKLRQDAANRRPDEDC